MNTVKKIGVVFLFLCGGFFAIAAIKMIFIDIPKGKKSQEEAVYVGRGEYDPANDGKTVIVCGEMKIVEPAYDDEVGISFDTMRVMRKTQTLELTDKKTKIEARGYYNQYLDWNSGLSEMKDYTAKADVGGFHLDQEYMDRIILDGKAEYDEEKLEQQGYRVVKDRNFSQTFFIQPVYQTERYPQKGDYRYEYSSSKYGTGSTVTVVGVQYGDTLRFTGSAADCIREGELTKEEFREENRKGNVGAIIMGIVLPFAFFAAGIFLLISSGSSGESV
ncbi:MAG: TMEM43 family protein [Clostridiaceae bacterium]